MVRSRKRSRALEAFTLMEAMIVIIIIAVSIGLAAPGLGSAMAERRTNQAALDVVRMIRHARSEAAAYGRAHLVRIGETRIDVFRGINGGCNTNDWETILDAGECGEEGSMCVDGVDVTGYPYTIGSESIALGGTADAGTELCYESLGIMRWRTSAEMRFTDRNSTEDGEIGGGVRISFTRSDDGEQEGVVRWVVLPLSGDARVLR